MTSTEEPTVNVKFCLAFPREAVSVPVMRRVLGDTLRNLGVVDDCIGDILVAVTEACTNVLRHGGPARRYEVVTSVGATGCLVEVLDSGLGPGARRAATEVRRPGDAAVGMPGEMRSRGTARAQGLPPALDRALAQDRRGAQDRPRAQDRTGAQDRPCTEEYAVPREVAAGLAGGPRNKARPKRRPDDQLIARLPESGRGLQIMRALVDDVSMRSGPGRGTVVSMRKRLAWRHDAPLAGLSDGKLRDAG